MPCVCVGRSTACATLNKRRPCAVATIMRQTGGVGLSPSLEGQINCYKHRDCYDWSLVYLSIKKFFSGTFVQSRLDGLRFVSKNRKWPLVGLSVKAGLLSYVRSAKTGWTTTRIKFCDWPWFVFRSGRIFCRKFVIPRPDRLRYTSRLFAFGLWSVFRSGGVFVVLEYRKGYCYTPNNVETLLYTVG